MKRALIKALAKRMKHYEGRYSKARKTHRKLKEMRVQADYKLSHAHIAKKQGRDRFVRTDKKTGMDRLQGTKQGIQEALETRKKTSRRGRKVYKYAVKQIEKRNTILKGLQRRGVAKKSKKPYPVP